MAQELVDKAVEVGGLEDTRGCQTDGFMLEGSDGWFPTYFIRLVQDYGVDVDVSALCLFKTFGFIVSLYACFHKHLVQYRSAER